MPVLNKEVKVYIVCRLAQWETLQQVQAGVKERFGLDLRHQQVSGYDPSTLVGSKRLSPELQQLFKDERERFRKDIANIPIANKVVRLTMLQRAAMAAEKAGNRQQLRELLEQAAKECHDTWAPKREVTLKGEMKHEHNIKEWSDQQIVDSLAKYGVLVPPVVLSGASNEPVVIPRGMAFGGKAA